MNELPEITEGVDNSIPVCKLSSDERTIKELRRDLQELRLEINRLRQEASDRTWLDNKWGS